MNTCPTCEANLSDDIPSKGGFCSEECCTEFWAAYDEPFGYEPYGAQDGSYYVGTFRNRQGRHVKLRRIGTGPVSGNSFQFRHANARVRR